MTDWEQSSKLILLQLHEKLSKNSKVDHSMVIQHLKQIGEEKKLNQWVPHELTANKKIVILKVPLPRKESNYFQF